MAVIRSTMRASSEPIDACVNELCGVRTPPEARVLAPAETVLQAITRLATEAQPWIDSAPSSPVILLVLLEGGRFFGDRLASGLRERCTSDFSRVDLKVSTRDSNGSLLAEPSIATGIERLQGRRVLIVDDILDSGATLRIVTRHIASTVLEFRSMVLVQKDDPRAAPGIPTDRPKADFVGLKFTDSRWFSGAGMDMPGDPTGRARLSETIIAYPPIA